MKEFRDEIIYIIMRYDNLYFKYMFSYIGENYIDNDGW